VPKPFKGTLKYDPHSLKKRPNLAVHIGHIAHIWTMIDVLHGEMLAEMLRSESRFTTAVYLRLRGARPHALDAVAEEVLTENLLKEFRKIMERCRKVESSRNDVVHGLWGIDESDDKVLIWIDPAAHVKWFSATVTLDVATASAANTASSDDAWKRMEDALDKHLGSTLSYTEADFIEIENRISEIFSLVYRFSEKLSQQLGRQYPSNTTEKK